MNIYIYGSRNFKKDIHNVLNRSKIRTKLDDETLIADISSIDELKETIESCPEELYLIDNSKIVKKSSLGKKIKFLIPKDGIDEEFLVENGIAELSVNSLEEIPKYILKKYDEKKSDNKSYEDINYFAQDNLEEAKEPTMDLDDELSMLLAKESESSNDEIDELKNETLDDIFSFENDDNNLENMIGEIDEESDFQTNLDEDFNDNFGLNNISFDYDDKEIVNDIFEKNEDIFDNVSQDENEEFELNDLENDATNDYFNEVFEDLNLLDEPLLENSKKINEDNYLKEKDMIDDDFSELDSLNEKDVFEAINGSGAVFEELKDISQNKNISSNMTNNSIQVSNGTNVNDLAHLLSNLLTNKTLEITIKIKD